MVAVRDSAKELPKHLSLYKLNEDGTYETAFNATPSVYIKDSQSAAIWNPTIAQRIRETYGPYVCIMHEKLFSVTVPVAQTFKFILGN